jgi:hypothetical protein
MTVAGNGETGAQQRTLVARVRTNLSGCVWEGCAEQLPIR